nr:reverse transcriptase domain-containing protein [Tanacetum cinerariifolium]
MDRPAFDEKVEQEKLKAVKARLNFEEVSKHVESGTPSRGTSKRGSDLDVSTSCPKVLEILRVVTRAPNQEVQSLPLRNIITKEHPHTRWKLCQKAKVAQKDTESQGKKSKGQALRTMIYPSYGRSPQDFLGSNKSGTLGNANMVPHTGSSSVWFDDLPPESVDSYDDLKEAFLANFCQQKKDVKGAPEIMRISRFMNGITNLKLIKCLHDIIPKSVDEMMRITTSFLRGEVAACNQEQKKSLSSWKQQEAGHKQNFKK